jgi:hypothetical protein
MQKKSKTFQHKKTRRRSFSLLFSAFFSLSYIIIPFLTVSNLFLSFFLSFFVTLMLLSLIPHSFPLLPTCINFENIGKVEFCSADRCVNTNWEDFQDNDKHILLRNSLFNFFSSPDIFLSKKWKTNEDKFEELKKETFSSLSDNKTEVKISQKKSKGSFLQQWLLQTQEHQQ